MKPSMKIVNGKNKSSAENFARVQPCIMTLKEDKTVQVKNPDPLKF